MKRTRLEDPGSTDVKEREPAATDTRSHGSAHVTSTMDRAAKREITFDTYHPHTAALVAALEGVAFPAPVPAMLDAARAHNASEDIIRRIGNLSVDIYPDLDSVIESVGL